VTSEARLRNFMVRRPRANPRAVGSDSLPPALKESPLILALETSCDETAVSILRGGLEPTVLASEISSQIALHQPFGGVVPEVASRNHMLRVRPLVEQALEKAGCGLNDIDAFAATAGPGLASSLLIGNTLAKGLALACQRPFLAINHLEGHLLSPFMTTPSGRVRSCVALIVSGGHTMLLHCRGMGNYELLGRSHDDAAGEAFDKVGKLLGLPYPGGPEIDKRAPQGNPLAFDLPRSMLHSGDFYFSFSGLKTAVLYTVEKLPQPLETQTLDNLCASFQAAVTDVLVAKTIAAARYAGESRVAVSGGVSCNRGLRQALTQACESEGLELLLAAPAHTTDNAAMIAFVAALKFQAGEFSSLNEDVNPNLQLVSGGNRRKNGLSL
jgi:N6-L-threonylcarbamoyladenine synthase